MVSSWAIVACAVGGAGEKGRVKAGSDTVVRI